MAISNTSCYLDWQTDQNEKKLVYHENALIRTGRKVNATWRHNYWKQMKKIL